MEIIIGELPTKSDIGKIHKHFEFEFDCFDTLLKWIWLNFQKMLMKMLLRFIQFLVSH